MNDRLRMASQQFDSRWRRAAIVALTFAAGTLALMAIAGCGGESEASKQAAGEKLFTTAFAGTNGRSCASCHVPKDNFTLTPAHATALYATNPKDPLFAAIDADDPNAKVLTFDHLKKGLIRVWLTLPKKMDVIDDAGKVITPADRKIWVWRAVPSIADVALTAPYQLDGRETALNTQAQGAVTSHSEGGTISAGDLEKIAAYERSVFSSDRAAAVARKVDAGTAVEDITDADASLTLTAKETRGREVYENACAACHGGATGSTVKDREVHAQSFPALNPDGTVQYKVPATNPPTPILASHASEFINIGSAAENYMAQVSKTVGFRLTEHVAYTEGLSYPQYRFRFYKDDTQSEVVAELPPALPAGPAAFQPVNDKNNNPVTGPNNLPQLYTTDPGRAAITGDPLDFEAFDVPTLRGIAKTAPYWHNNISEKLEDVISLYSDHLLAKYPTLSINTGPAEPDKDGDIGPKEALSKQQKADLLAYLKRL